MAKMTFRSDDYSPEDGEWKTFKEWEALGYGVIKGERAKRFIHGVAVFHESQVINIEDEFENYMREELRGMYCGREWWKD